MQLYTLNIDHYFSSLYQSSTSSRFTHLLNIVTPEDLNVRDKYQFSGSGLILPCFELCQTLQDLQLVLKTVKILFYKTEKLHFQITLPYK